MLVDKIAIFCLILAALIYLLWKDIPSSMEERKIAYTYQPVFNLVEMIQNVMWLLGCKDVYWLPQYIVHKIAHPKSVPESASYRIYNDEFDDVKVRIYQWKHSSNYTSGAVIYFHGGGYTNYDAYIYDDTCTDLLFDLKVPIISVNYRRAPVYQSPTAFTDSIKASQYFLREVQANGRLYSLQVDPTRVVYMGDSAGGHIALSVALYLTKTPASSPPPKAAVLVYPITQSLTMNTPSYLEHANGFIWKRKYAVWSFMAFHQGNCQENFLAFQANNFTSYATRTHYADKLNLPQLKHRATDREGNIRTAWDGEGEPQLIERFRSMYEDELNSPLLADLSNFPPSLVITCELDVLRDDGEMLVDRLRQLHRPVEHTRYHTVHGIFSLDKRRSIEQPFTKPQEPLTPTQRMYKSIIDFSRHHLSEN